MKSLYLILAGALIAPLHARVLFPEGEKSEWKYSDTAPAAADWSSAEFDDKTWKTGAAPLGYGEDRLTTKLGDAETKPFTVWFRRTFELPEREKGEAVFAVLTMDDGAIIYLNGKEVARPNMPKGEVKADTPARRALDDSMEGFYLRLPLPDELLQKGKNVIAVEVHQASARSSDLYFDLAVKSCVVPDEGAAISAEAEAAVKKFHETHRLEPELKIPDGYIDGGRRMKKDGEGEFTSGRELLLVDRKSDPELKALLAWAGSEEMRKLPGRERTARIVKRIDTLTTPPGGEKWVAASTEAFADEFANRPLPIGTLVEQCQAGVCRHRSLLFKLAADEAGLKSALVRGNYHEENSEPLSGAHAWNEVTLDSGETLLVDIMHHGGEENFRPVTDPEIVKTYLRVDDKPWYGETKSADAEKP